MRCLVFVLLCCAGSLHAQRDFRIARQYAQQHGLSHSAIYALCEDARGFLWIATEEGLNRFDGLHFKTWYHNKRDSNSLAHNAVNDILEYQPGMLLIATGNGLSVFNTRLGKCENERMRGL